MRRSAWGPAAGSTALARGSPCGAAPGEIEDRPRRKRALLAGEPRHHGGDFRRPPEVVSEETEGFVDSIAQPGKRLVMRVDFTKVIGRQEMPTGS